MKIAQINSGFTSQLTMENINRYGNQRLQTITVPVSSLDASNDSSYEK